MAVVVKGNLEEQIFGNKAWKYYTNIHIKARIDLIVHVVAILVFQNSTCCGHKVTMMIHIHPRAWVRVFVECGMPLEMSRWTFDESLLDKVISTAVIPPLWTLWLRLRLKEEEGFSRTRRTMT